MILDLGSCSEVPIKESNLVLIEFSLSPKKEKFLFRLIQIHVCICCTISKSGLFELSAYFIKVTLSVLKILSFIVCDVILALILFRRKLIH